MKKELIEKIIPERKEFEAIYICENCDDEWKTDTEINKCPVCGKDVCDSCGIKIYLYEHYLEDNSDYWSRYLLNKYHCFDKSKELYVHEHCYKNIRKKIKAYEKNCEKAIKETITKLDKLEKELFSL